MQKQRVMQDGTILKMSTKKVGPSHDPYVQETIEVKRPDGTLQARYVSCMSETLTLFDETGQQSNEYIAYDKPAMKSLEDFFKKATGYSCQEVNDIIYTPIMQCEKCGSHDIVTVEGYPGEMLYICENRHVVDSYFDLSAVI